MGSKVNPDRQTLGEMDVHSEAEGVVPRLQVAADPSFSLSLCASDSTPSDIGRAPNLFLLYSKTPPSFSGQAGEVNTRKVCEGGGGITCR